MATTPKAAAARAAGRKPAAPVVHAQMTEQAAADGVALYRVSGRIWHNGQLLRPANPTNGREADTVALTEREAHGLRGFVEPMDTTLTTTTTTAETTATLEQPS